MSKKSGAPDAASYAARKRGVNSRRGVVVVDFKQISSEGTVVFTL
ncbi:MAG TPA: hypothetical protein VG733_02495 [Chthoniobacteraceae bacterium]|nr:hypothetical protein [Chthoniobacteraceae bacterium]